MDLFGVGTPGIPRELVLPVLAVCLAYLGWLFRAPLLKSVRYLRRVR